MTSVVECEAEEETYECIEDETTGRQYVRTGISMNEIVKKNGYWILRVRDSRVRRAMQKNPSCVRMEGDEIHVDFETGTEVFFPRIQRLGTYVETWSTPTDETNCLTQKKGTVTHLVTIDEPMDCIHNLDELSKKYAYGILPLVSQLRLDEKPTNNLNLLRSQLGIRRHILSDADDLLFSFVQHVQELNKTVASGNLTSSSSSVRYVDFSLLDESIVSIPFTKRRPSSEHEEKSFRVADRNDYFLNDTLQMLFKLNHREIQLPKCFEKRV
jgi:hypothetical protein